MDFGTVQDSSMLSQLSFESGMVDFTDGWSVNSGARLSKLGHGGEAFEGGAAAAAGHGHRNGHGHGHGQHENYTSSSTSSEMQMMTAVQVQNRAGKRKASAEVKEVGSTSTSSGKVLEGDPKCLKVSNNSGKGGHEMKSAERNSNEQVDSGGSLSPTSLKEASSKLQEPPKQDYIHVRARRGQATDSHSLAERVRREKISERMKFLQDLVPGCSKVTGKAVMLDEIINYVQSLQRQIEFLSMKLAAIDSQLDINLEHQLHKELAAQARSPETTLMGPDPSAGYREYQSHLQIQQQINNCNMDLRSVGTLCDAYLRSSMSNYAPMQLAPLAYAESFLDPFTQTLSGVVCDGDLQSIVHMGNSQAGRSEFFGQGRLHGPGFMSPGFLKVEY